MDLRIANLAHPVAAVTRAVTVRPGGDGEGRLEGAFCAVIGVVWRLKKC